MEIPKRNKLIGIVEEKTRKADHKKLAYKISDSTIDKAHKFLSRNN